MELFRRRSEQEQHEIEYQKARKVAEQYWEKGAEFVEAQDIAGHLGLRGREIEFASTLAGGKILDFDIDSLDDILRGYDCSQTRIIGMFARIDPVARRVERRRVIRNGQRLYRLALNDSLEVMQQDPVARNFSWTLNNAINDLFARIRLNDPRTPTLGDTLATDAMNAWSELWHERLVSSHQNA